MIHAFTTLNRGVQYFSSVVGLVSGDDSSDLQVLFVVS